MARPVGFPLELNATDSGAPSTRLSGRRVDSPMFRSHACRSENSIAFGISSFIKAPQFLKFSENRKSTNAQSERRLSSPIFADLIYTVISLANDEVPLRSFSCVDLSVRSNIRKTYARNNRNPSQNKRKHVVGEIASHQASHQRGLDTLPPHLPQMDCHLA